MKVNAIYELSYCSSTVGDRSDVSFVFGSQTMVDLFLYCDAALPAELVDLLIRE